MINKPLADKFYSIREIHTQGFLPWVKSYQTARRLVLARSDVFRPITHDTGGRRKSYRIKGTRIIKFLEGLDLGEK